MTSTNNVLKMIVSLKGGLANEVRRDSFFNSKWELRKDLIFDVPRIEKLKFLHKKEARSFLIILKILYIIWPFLLYPVIVIFTAIKCSTIPRRSYKTTSQNIYLSNSPISVSLGRNHLEDAEIFWLKSKSMLTRDEVIHNKVCEWASISDIFKSVCYSFLVYYNPNTKLLSRKDRLQSYVICDWFIHWFALRRLIDGKENIIFSADADRWAVLFAEVPTKAKKTIIQHGLFLDNNQNLTARPPSELAFKLRNISTMFLIDMSQKDIYIKNVLWRGTKAIFKLQRQNNFEVVDLPIPFDRSVLMVCFPNTFDNEMACLEFLLEACPRAIFYIKPHPSYSQKRYEQKCSNRIQLLNKNILPIVDVVLFCTHSTIVYHLEKKIKKVANIQTNSYQSIAKMINE